MELGKIETSNEALCDYCETNKFKTINPDGQVDYGRIVMHKKDCKYLVALLKNSREVWQGDKWYNVNYVGRQSPNTKWI